jgi:hypothetical protein
MALARQFDVARLSDIFSVIAYILALLPAEGRSTSVSYKCRAPREEVSDGLGSLQNILEATVTQAGQVRPR